MLEGLDPVCARALAVAAARTLGRLAPASCAAFARARGSCKGRMEAHHEDYTAPLTVVWLCRRHHALLTKLTSAWGLRGGYAVGPDATPVPFAPVQARRDALALLCGELAPAPTDRAWAARDAWERRERRSLKAGRGRSGRPHPDATTRLVRRLAARRARENPPHILHPPAPVVRRRPRDREPPAVLP